MTPPSLTPTSAAPAASEEYFKNVLNSLPAAIYTTNATGQITYYNEAAAALWGHRPALGHSEWCGSWKLFWPDGRPLAHGDCPMAVAIKEKRIVRGMEAIAERPDGTRVPFIPYPTPLFDDSGNLIGGVNMLVDVSDRKRADDLLRRQARRLDALNRAAKTIASELDPQRVVQTVTDIATELSGAKFGAFFYNTIDSSGESYVLYTLSGAPRAAFEKFGMPRNTAVFGPTFRGEGVIRSDDIRKDVRYGKNAPHHGMPEGHLPVVSYLAVPVMARSGEVLGGLFFGHDQVGVFGEETEELVAGIAAHAAIALENAHLHAEAQKEIAHRRQAEEATQGLAAIVQNSDDAILTKDLNGIITSWNLGAQRLFGYSSKEIVGKSVMVLIPPDRADEEPEILSRIRAGEHIDHYETVRRHKDGSLIDISITVSPVRNATDEIVGASKIARDITQRRQAQERQLLLLKEMDHRVKNLFAVASGVVSMSVRSAETPAALAADISARLGALSRVHDLTMSNSFDATGRVSSPAELHALIAAIVSPYERKPEEGSPRFVVRGDDVSLSQQTASGLALLIHEFATNATKYGALSVPDGRVEIDCAKDDKRFRVAWREYGGPRIGGAPQSEGFGSLLSRGIVKNQLDGAIRREWSPEGLRVHIDVAYDRLS